MKLKSIALLLVWLSFICFKTVSAQLKGHWDTVISSKKLEGRSECSLAAINGKLYLLGSDGPAMPVGIYDPTTTSWTSGAVSPVVLHHFQAVALGTKVYVLDAFYAGGFPNQDPAPNAYSYDTKTDTWQQLAGLPADRRRAGAGAAAYKGKLYLVCGIKHGHASGTNNLFDEYDPKTDSWTTLPDAPHIRDHAMAVVVGDKLYAVGGRNTSFRDPERKLNFFSQVVLDVDVYDFTTRKWSTLDAKLPKGTGGGTAVNLDGTIYYIGGERATASSPNGPQKDVYSLNVSDPSATWQVVAALNKARNGVGGTVMDHKIYIAGGAQGGPGGPGPGGPPPNAQMPGGPPPGDQFQGGLPPNGPPPNGPPPGGGGDIALEVFILK